MRETAPLFQDGTVSPALDVSALQRHASDPSWSIWVGASAGSGKTKVLADRVTRLLLAGVAPQKILCLTFTKAAAAEMAIRLTQRLSRWATCSEERLDEDLAELEGEGFDRKLRGVAERLFAQVLSCPGGMRIQTIHAFAQEILRRFPLEAGLAPHFTVMDDSDAQALWQDSLDAVFESAAERGDAEASAALSFLVQRLGEASLKAILREVAGQTARLGDLGSFASLSRSLRSALALGPEEDADFLKRDAVAEGRFEREALAGAARLIVEKGSESFQKKAARILHWLEQDAQGRLVWLDDYLGVFLTLEGTPRKALANKELISRFPQIEAVLQAEARRAQSLRERLDSLQIVQETESVLVLALRLAREYAARKSAVAALDYDDLIARTEGVLTRPGIAPWVLFKLDGGIDHILVDESQDTSPDSWRIVAALADEYFSGQSARSDRLRTLFVVGDEKQSIYSFLKADPAAFAKMRAHFTAQIRAAGAPFDEVPLNVSFRSAPAILRAVDAVFAADSVSCGVSRDPVRHRAFRREAAGRVEVWPLLTPPEEEGGEKKRLKKPEDWVLPIGYETAHDPAAALARRIAERIKAWLAAGETVFDRGKKMTRPMTPGDVMVLVQRRGAFVDHLVRALKALAVPVSGVDRMALTRQLAVMDLMALLNFALLPQDDLTLASVLRGPLIGASEDDLMALAIGREGSLWDALRSSGEREAWRVYLHAVAAMADRMSPLAMLSRLLSEPCPADPVSGRRALARRLGPEAEDPIDELLGAAEAFSSRHSPSLQAFLRSLLASDTQIKREMESASGRVRITTVHASKGLEAPVVILPDAAHVPEKTKLPKLLWASSGPEGGEALPFYVPRDPQNALLRAARSAARDRQLEEYRRLLYVALTRAEGRLIVCGYQTHRPDKMEASWYALVAAALKPLNQAQEGDEAGVVLADPSGGADVVLPEEAGAKEGKEEGIGAAKAASLPPWLFSPPPQEPSPPRPFVPSRPEAEEPGLASPRDAVRFKRGRLLHRLLQSLPDLEPERREEAARRFLASPAQALSPEQRSEMEVEVLRLLADERFAPLFAPGSRAEVPLIGVSGERLISGQVDRLALVNGEVWIVDYKTNRPPPEKASGVPAVYKGQMEAYRAVLQEIYPGKPVRCFLLWTYAPRLMEILP